MSSFMGQMGLAGGAGGTGFDKPELAKIMEQTNPEQLQQALQASQAGMQGQQALLGQMQGQGGLGKQTDVYGQFQDIAAGKGPNPAQAMLNESTGQNVANQAALMAGQRGSSANAGLMARQAGSQGAATQQQAAGQAATMQANQSLNALQQAGGMATTMAGQQVGQTNQNVESQMAQQQMLQNAAAAQNQANIANQASVNQANAQMASGQIANQGAMGQGMMNIGAGMMKAEGGQIPKVTHDVGSKLKSGGRVPGKPKFRGNSYANDTVKALLSPGELVVDRETMMDPGPAGQAARFLAEAIADRKRESYLGDRPLDFSQFRKIKSDKDSSTLEHVDGHLIKISHDQISPKLKALFKRMPLINNRRFPLGDNYNGSYYYDDEPEMDDEYSQYPTGGMSGANRQMAENAIARGAGVRGGADAMRRQQILDTQSDSMSRGRPMSAVNRAGRLLTEDQQRQMSRSGRIGAENDVLRHRADLADMQGRMTPAVGRYAADRDSSLEREKTQYGQQRLKSAAGRKGMSSSGYEGQYAGGGGVHGYSQYPGGGAASSRQSRPMIRPQTARRPRDDDAYESGGSTETVHRMSGRDLNALAERQGNVGEWNPESEVKMKKVRPGYTKTLERGHMEGREPTEGFPGTYWARPGDVEGMSGKGLQSTFNT